MYIFFPAGGLGNRMRVIDSAYRFCNKYNKSFKIYWIRTNGVDVHFSSIFKPIDKITDINFDIVSLIDKLRRKSILFRWILIVLKKLHIFNFYLHTEYDKWFDWVDNYDKNSIDYLFFVVSSYSMFCTKGTNIKFNNQIFELTQELSDRVKIETNMFSKNTIGMHIRRTDNLISIEKSPTCLFENYIRNAIANNNLTIFYVASDSEDVLRNMKQLFPNNVIIPEGIRDNNSEEGIKQGVVELYTLSRTSKIIGSYYSSFSTMAALIGNIPIERLLINN